MEVLHSAPQRIAENDKPSLKDDTLRSPSTACLTRFEDVDMKSQPTSLPISSPADTVAGSSTVESYEVVPAVAALEVSARDPKLPCFVLGDYWRKDAFMGREDTLKIIDDHLLPENINPDKGQGSDSSSQDGSDLRSFAICGLGGIGKTELAVQYAHTRKKYFEAIFWLGADDSKILASSFANLAVQLGLEDEDSVDVTASRDIVMGWLSRPLRQTSKPDEPGNFVNWLLIFDNVDNLDVLDDYWPKLGRGSVLITSRDPNAKQNMYIHEGLHLPPLTNTETEVLMQKLTHPLNTIRNEPHATWYSSQGDSGQGDEKEAKYTARQVTVLQSSPRFSPADNSASNFSIPSLPSSSTHLIELPVIAIGKRTGSISQLRTDKIDQLRREGALSLSSHYHENSKLSSSQMQLRDSMVRNFYVFDEIYFAIEQRISICLQLAKNQKTFTCSVALRTVPKTLHILTLAVLVWLDAGADFPDLTLTPWSVRTPESYYLPVIRHKPMIALKCHLFADQPSDRMDFSGGKIQSLSNLPNDYGRSLRPSIKAKDPFYNLNKVFNFAASSQVQFLNLIDAKLDSYISRPADQEYESLPNLKYTKEILYRHLQKTKQVLESIKNAQLSTWPKDDSDSNKANIAAQSVDQDFQYILDRTINLHARTTEAITVLMSSMSISESQRAIGQAQRIGKLTFLAFIFWWFVMSAPIVGLVFTLYLVDVSVLWDGTWEYFRARWGLSQDVESENRSSSSVIPTLTIIKNTFLTHHSIISQC
ncbi:hypothetical protein CEP53_004673 [Fusarium sp. AF-6]|nr:hypothetical protein CEP53_004673 [Fusarium sp. AF-6]